MSKHIFSHHSIAPARIKYDVHMTRFFKSIFDLTFLSSPSAPERRIKKGKGIGGDYLSYLENVNPTPEGVGGYHSLEVKSRFGRMQKKLEHSEIVFRGITLSYEFSLSNPCNL